MKKTVIFLLLFFSCFIVEAQKFDSAFHYKIKNFDAAVFPKEYDRKLYDDTSIHLRFTPDTNQVIIAYKALIDSIQRMPKYFFWQGHRHKSETLLMLKKYINTYKWQIFGCIDKNNHKLLLIVGFSPFFVDEEHFDWLKEEFYLDDGGCEYWQALYNLDTGQIIFFYCNGEA